MATGSAAVGVAMVQIGHVRMRVHGRLVRMRVGVAEVGRRAGVGVEVVTVVVGVLVIVLHGVVDVLMEVT